MLLCNVPTNSGGWTTRAAITFRDTAPVSIRPRYVEREINAGLLLAEVLREAEANFQKGGRR
jgi:hypothetical protein